MKSSIDLHNRGEDVNNFNECVFHKILEEKLRDAKVNCPNLMYAAFGIITEIIDKVTYTKGRMQNYIYRPDIERKKKTRTKLVLEVINELLKLSENQEHYQLFERIKNNIIMNPDVTQDVLVEAFDVTHNTLKKALELINVVAMNQSEQTENTLTPQS